MNILLRHKAQRDKPYLIDTGAGLFDYSIIGGNKVWIFADGRRSTSNRPAFTTTKRSKTKLYFKFMSRVSVNLNDNDTNALNYLKLRDLRGKPSYYLSMVSSTNLKGDLADLQGKSKYLLSLSGCSLVTGDIANLRGHTRHFLSLSNTLVYGDLATLGGYFDSYISFLNCTGVYGIYTPVGDGTPDTISLSNTGLTTNDMDQTLINIADASIPKSNGSFTATGMTRSSTSTTAVNTLISRGWTITGLTVV